jgi:phosphopantetheine adenylyltransferase
MESLEIRMNNVEKFLRNVNRNLVYHVIPIHDDYGPTITDASIQALVGSLETYNGCKAGIYLFK